MLSKKVHQLSHYCSFLLKRRRRRRKSPLWTQVSTSSTCYCYHKPSPRGLSHPLVTLSVLLIMSPSSLCCLAGSCCTEIAARGDKRGTMAAPPFHLPQLQDQMVGLCVSIWGKCSSVSASHSLCKPSGRCLAEAAQDKLMF